VTVTEVRRDAIGLGGEKRTILAGFYRFADNSQESSAANRLDASWSVQSDCTGSVIPGCMARSMAYQLAGTVIVIRDHDRAEAIT
jgi:hypothetical protein